MNVRTVRMRVPRVVAQVADLLGLTVPAPTAAQEVTPVVHDSESLTIRQRVQNVNLLADVIQMDPRSWGVWADEKERLLFASRLLEMRNRVRSCSIEEAREVASL